jgi:hypothetical protein
MVSAKVEDASSVLPYCGQFYELSEIQFSRSRRENDGMIRLRHPAVHNFGSGSGRAHLDTATGPWLSAAVAP